MNSHLRGCWTSRLRNVEHPVSGMSDIPSSECRGKRRWQTKRCSFAFDTACRPLFSAYWRTNHPPTALSAGGWVRHRLLRQSVARLVSRGGLVGFASPSSPVSPPVPVARRSRGVAHRRQSCPILRMGMALALGSLRVAPQRSAAERLGRSKEGFEERCDTRAATQRTCSSLDDC